MSTRKHISTDDERKAGKIWDELDVEERFKVFNGVGYSEENVIWMLDPMTMQWEGVNQKRFWYPKLTPTILKLYGGKNEKR